MSDEWVMVPREASEAMIRAGYSAPTVFGVRDMANTYRAMLAAAPDAPQRNREADRARYIDRAFNEWLDDSVADGGATVWDLVSDVHSAWAAWTAHPHYATPAAPQQAEPVAWMDKGETGGKGQTKVRVASTETLSGMPEIARRAYVVPLYLHPPVAPQQAEPVAQIGWADEFGNLFPMGAWKPAQRTHHDSHKTAWRPVFLHPPAAEVQQAEPVGDFQRSAPGKIWMNLGNDGMDEIEYPTWDALVRADENITWSEDRIDATDIPYVRADLAHPPAAEVQRLRAAALALLNELDAGRHGAHEFNELRNAARAAQGGEHG